MRQASLATRADYMRAYRRRNSKKLAASARGYKRAWSLRNPHKLLFVSRRASARRAGIPFTILFGEMVWPELCPVLGIKIDYSEGKGAVQQDSPSIDRKVPDLGYVPGNVSVISFRANAIKNSGTAEEHRLIAQWMSK